MALLKNPWHETPPGGFIVTIPAAKTSNQFWSFAEAIAWYQGVQQANPSLGLLFDPKAIEQFISQQNALRVMTMSGGETYITKGGPVQTTETKKAANLFLPVVAVADKVKQLVAGADTIEAWKAEGSPVVAQAEADRRAVICATCPKNGKGDLTRWFTIPVSQLIQKYYEQAKKMKLSTPSDEQLGVCEACLCPMKVKVHFPQQMILDHITAKAKADLDPRCWITK